MRPLSHRNAALLLLLLGACGDTEDADPDVQPDVTFADASPTDVVISTPDIVRPGDIDRADEPEPAPDADSPDTAPDTAPDVDLPDTAPDVDLPDAEPDVEPPDAGPDVAPDVDPPDTAPDAQPTGCVEPPGTALIGCAFVSTVLRQYEDPSPGAGPNPGLVVVNPGNRAATVTFTRADGVDVIPGVSVAPGTSRFLILDDIDARDVHRTPGIEPGAIFIDATAPIAVTQINHASDDAVISADGTALQRRSALGTAYPVIAWPGGVDVNFGGFQPQRATLTAVATEDGETEITARLTAASRPGSLDPAPDVDTPVTWTLQRGEVLTLDFARSTTAPASASDPTGSILSSTRPFAVFVGHEQAVVAVNGDPESCCADHLEHQLLPSTALGRTWALVPSPSRAPGVPDAFRVLATGGTATLDTNPTIAGVDGVTLQPGQVLDFQTDQPFVLTATANLAVAQLPVGGASTGIVPQLGDPSLVLPSPTDRAARSAVISIPGTWATRRAILIRNGTPTITTTGEAGAGTWTPIGTSTWQYSVWELDDQPFVVTASDGILATAWAWSATASIGFSATLAPD